MKSVTHSIFKTFLLSVLVVAQMHFAYAQTASILPPAKTTFLDANGKPLTAGTVESFIPATTTHKTTWQDAAETIPNANPLILDAAGRALLLGSGSYRQVVKDRLNNVIWDQVTSSTGSGSSGSTATGDGDLVGTIKPWAGMTAPNQYVFTYGQELSRTTYSALFTAITSTQAIFCNSGSPILNGLGDTTNFWIGMTVELSCVAPGFTTVISKTATTVTLALNSNVTTGTNAIFFPWGRGNGSTTFNVPDFRGFVLAGNNIMGGVSGSQLTTTFFGATDPNSSGAAGGNQNHSITLVEINGHNHPVFLTDPGHTHLAGQTTVINNGGGAGNNLLGTASNAVVTSSSTTGTIIRDAPNGGGAANQTNFAGGGIASNATLGSVGSGYTNGTQTITITGGTCTTQPQFTVTVAGNIFTGTPVLLTAGSCTVAPINPAVTSGGGGTGGTLNVAYSAQPISLIQPTKTSNYIIKVLSDDNSATASGVTALGGMTGSIACGTGLLCTGNNISVNGGIPPPTAVTLGGVFSKTCAGSSWFNQLDTTGSFTCTQPAFTDISGIATLAQGGTNANLTANNGGIFWSNATQAQILAGTATIRLPLVSGATAAPTWGIFQLPASVISGGILCFTSTSVSTSSVLQTANAIMLGGGSGVCPSPMASLGTTSTVLHGNAGGAPTFGAIVSADMNITATSCTNQFVSAISTGGIGTCTTDTLASAQHANQGTTTTVLHGNAAGNPAFGAVALATEVSGTLPVANGGTGDTGTAWTTFAPALSCGTATFTLNSARFKTLGKTVFFSIDFTITAIGTCTIAIQMTLPATPQSGSSMNGRESAINGILLGGTITAATATAFVAKSANAPWLVNERPQLFSIFESQ